MWRENDKKNYLRQWGRCWVRIVKRENRIILGIVCTFRSESCEEVFNAFRCYGSFWWWQREIWYFIAGYIYWNISIFILNRDLGIFVVIDVALTILNEGLRNLHSRTNTSPCNMNNRRCFFDSIICKNRGIREVLYLRIHFVFRQRIRLSPKLVLRVNLRVTFKLNRQLRIAFDDSFRRFDTHDLLRLFSSYFMWSLQTRDILGRIKQSKAESNLEFILFRCIVH